MKEIEIEIEENKNQMENVEKWKNNYSSRKSLRKSLLIQNKKNIQNKITLTNQQLTELYANCIKLSSENVLFDLYILFIKK